MSRITIVDPPEGWRYGFPAELQEDYTQQLLDAGYPVEDIPLAHKYSRYWTQEVTEDEHD